MSKRQFFKRCVFPLAIFTITLFIIFSNPFANLAKEPEITTTTYSNKELMQFHEKYSSLLYSIRADLRDQGYPLSVDFAMLNDEKVEIIIKRHEISNELKPKEIKEVEQLVNKFIEKQKFNPTMFQIHISNSTQPVLKTANRISYNDLIEYISYPLLDKGVNGFYLHNKFSPETAEIIIEFADPIDENSKNEIQKMTNQVLKKNNFDTSVVKFVITN
ncbi:hypothetical protein FJQ98_25285 [Lysinibacillus agricola]|uniref:Uncharacterized protein n=1 Tax=Lysinibacillus agricola TaxID=2590012 RepID=A0ABX7AQX9_9BACI|nr:MULTISPECIES: hypothetical protein [Lysinibacillus]KOS61584.1 hypothetical protein AN161_17135 [Lysinibacillus sp. FJAT-14222]QQP12357.1 hypothetical protein FJQ98_25285 [Lysinibacillus agricola]